MQNPSSGLQRLVKSHDRVWEDIGSWYLEEVDSDLAEPCCLGSSKMLEPAHGLEGHAT